MLQAIEKLHCIILIRGIDAAQQQAQRSNLRSQPVSPPCFEHLYLHVPFCSRRCSYCDFAIAVRRVVPVREFVAVVGREAGRHAADGVGSKLKSIYLGGGTPSKLGLDGIEMVLDTVRREGRFEEAPGAEVTIECNPEDISREALLAWRGAGVNRLSIGVQSFDDRVLQWMRRSHDAETAVSAVESAGAAGFDQISIDLIFGLPDTLGRDLSRDLDLAVSLDVKHLSVYGLTAEPKSPFGRWVARGTVREAPEERYESEFLMVHERLLVAGYEHYEVSNFAKPGHRSRHNASYWSRAPYLGLGPSAHSFDGERRRWWNAREYESWRRLVSDGGDPVAETELLGPSELQAERVYLGLRTNRGLPGTSEIADQVERFRIAGWARMEGGNVMLTPKGWLRLDSIAASLTACTSR